MRRIQVKLRADSVIRQFACETTVQAESTL